MQLHVLIRTINHAPETPRKPLVRGSPDHPSANTPQSAPTGRFTHPASKCGGHRTCTFEYFSGGRGHGPTRSDRCNRPMARKKLTIVTEARYPRGIGSDRSYRLISPMNSGINYPYRLWCAELGICRHSLPQCFQGQVAPQMPEPQQNRPYTHTQTAHVPVRFRSLFPPLSNTTLASRALAALWPWSRDAYPGLMRLRAWLMDCSPETAHAYRRLPLPKMRARIMADRLQSKIDELSRIVAELRAYAGSADKLPQSAHLPKAPRVEPPPD